MQKSQNITTSETSGQPTRIAFCITELDPGGAERALVQIVKQLDPARWQPKVFCLGPEGEMAIRLKEHGIPVECYGATSGGLFKALGAIDWLKRQLLEFQPRLLQCFLFHANIVGRIAGKRAEVPVILSGHRVAEKQKSWHLWLDWLTKNKVTKHVAVSEEVGVFVTRRLKLQPDQCCVIPNGVDTCLQTVTPLSDEELDELGVPRGARLIVAVGRLHPQKGFRELLGAMVQIRAAGLDAHLVIVGEGAQRSELELMIDALDLKSNVTLAGYRADVHSIMKRADVFVLSSRWEGMSNVLLEAMVLGLPIVATDVEGVRDLLGNNNAGLIVPPNDENELFQAIQRMLADPNLSRIMSGNAQHVVAQWVTWDQVADKYSVLYDRLLHFRTK